MLRLSADLYVHRDAPSSSKSCRFTKSRSIWDMRSSEAWFANFLKKHVKTFVESRNHCWKLPIKAETEINKSDSTGYKKGYGGNERGQPGALWRRVARNKIIWGSCDFYWGFFDRSVVHDSPKFDPNKQSDLWKFLWCEKHDFTQKIKNDNFLTDEEQN